MIGKILDGPIRGRAVGTAAGKCEWQRRILEYPLASVVIHVKTRALLSQQRLCKRPQLSGFPVSQAVKPGDLEMRRLFAEKRVGIED